MDRNKAAYKMTFEELVTPLAGVWIEIVSTPAVAPAERVTPLAGVWIEMPYA